mmetsp:Transcript_101286/g.315675  ORF Transcript_101286/g.315675 Transcript_101286/m.315675 type:complete len:494 (+) Transcript_101286:50-1531(+)
MAPVVSGREGQFVNAIPNDARYRRGNRSTLGSLCESAYQGDFEMVETLLSSGDEDNIFNGDVNLHYTDITALHMAAMAGHEDCVRLLLEARADPHVRARVPEGADPKTGETARQKADKFNHTGVAKLLQQAEKDQKPGWYMADGIGNNRKLYSEPKAQTGPGSRAVVTAPVPAAPAPAVEPSLPVALVFPGQGSQYVKMLEGVAGLAEVKEMLAKAKTILGYDLLQLCLEGPEDKLEQTRYCQPAMFVGGLAGVAKLRAGQEAKVIRARCVAGLSLGEYTALCAAGVLTFEDGLRLVKLRGEAMQEAALIGSQLMVSVVGLERAVLDGLCDAAAAKEGPGAVCKVANALFPKGFSCAGTAAAVTELKRLAEAKGAMQAKILKTGGAFHTSLMQPAQEKLRRALDEALPSMRPPRCDVYMNVTGKPVKAGSDPATIVELLNRQLVSPVLWSPSVEQMIADGVSEFFECGPQKQLKAMMKRINQKVWNTTTSMEV